ncbi:hypothetical protein M426DRAFT_21731 [Hypoxylon sp. CI-4A]|nr:hypothetical protein M426DRAFT_21731 [Hypoxylon sp. CI-4A]
MKLAVIAAIFAAVPAWALYFTNGDFVGIQTGKPFTITWTEAVGPVTITLMNGNVADLQTVAEITSGQPGESYTWVPSGSLVPGNYAMQITDGISINYSLQFPIQQGMGGTFPAPSTSSVISTVPSTTSAAPVSTTTQPIATATVSPLPSAASGNYVRPFNFQWLHRFVGHLI